MLTRRRDGREREDAHWLAELLTRAAFWLACIVLRLDREVGRG